VREFQPYINHLKRLTVKPDEYAAVADALDGQAAVKLRELVPTSQRRAAGAYFTSRKLAADLWALAVKTTTGPVVLLDPACGAGDLLMPALPWLLKHANRRKVAPESLVLGMDIAPEFVEATRLRLTLAFHSLGLRSSASEFSGVSTKDALSDIDTIQRATHILVNPPYTHEVLTNDWTSGRTNRAAHFIDHILNSCRPDTWIWAILPDVLRSGARYARWRRSVVRRARVDHISVMGPFDSHTDVDVFILGLEARRRVYSGRSADNWSKSRATTTVGEAFRISVGPVVNYRHSHTGPKVPYLVASDATPFAEEEVTGRTRRFAGRLQQPPFVAIRRTSSPSDEQRGIGTLIVGDRPVAVDNHLMIAAPRSGSIDDCRALVAALSQRRTTVALNRSIRCRHLTVGSVTELALPQRPNRP